MLNYHVSTDAAAGVQKVACCAAAMLTRLPFTSPPQHCNTGSIAGYQCLLLFEEEAPVPAVKPDQTDETET
jgi:hypothetical protein